MGALTATRLQEPAQETRRNLPLRALIAGLVVLMIVVGVAAAFAYQYYAPPDRATPQATVSGYFTALEQQNYARAWQFTSASRNDPNSQATYSNAFSADDARYGVVTGFTISQMDSDNTSHMIATVNVTRAKSPGSPITYSVNLTEYEGSTWLIDSASSQ